MEIKPDEIASILRERIEGLDTGSADLSEVGTVLSVADILTDTIRRIFTDDSVSEVFGGENQLF